MRRIAVAAVLIPVLLSCAGSSGWISPIARDHALVGRIWRPATAQFVTRQTVERAAAASDFVLLGETHDNPDHHVLQAALVRAMVAADRRPAIVFEMIAEDRQPAIDRWRSAAPADAAKLGAAVGWEAAGWPPWPDYQPIAEAALSGGLPVRGGNLSRRLMKAVLKRGPAALKAVRRARLGLDAPLPAQAESIIRDELFEAHCRLMPKTALSPLVDVQRARDAVLADNLRLGAALAGTDGAVLIAGSGHVRADYGAPMYLARLVPGRSILTIAFVEVDDGATSPGSYGEHFGGGLPFDFIWFTPRADDRDHCAELKERLRLR